MEQQIGNFYIKGDVFAHVQAMLPWKGWELVKPIFLARLKEAEYLASSITYRTGFDCVLCETPQGNQRFISHGREHHNNLFAHHKQGFTWESTYHHMVAEHNVVCPKDFWLFIVKFTSKFEPASDIERRFMKKKKTKVRKPTWSINVVSSNIDTAVYNVNTERLLIKFNNGGQYIYSDVTVDEIVEFTLAESQGSYFSKHIKANKPCTKR